MSADAFTVPVYEARRARGPIQIDGALDEFEWLTAPRLSLVKQAHNPEDNLPLRDSTQVSALWDEQNFYLAFIIEDREIWATLTAPGARLFPEECVEFFLDPDGDGQQYVEAQINSVNNIRDLLVDFSIKDPTYPQYDVMAQWDFQRLQKAIRIHRDAQGKDRGWTLEIAIPWTEFQFSRKQWPPRPGDELRMNFYRFERSRTGALPLETSAWSRVPGTFHDPPRFGRIVFRD